MNQLGKYRLGLGLLAIFICAAVVSCSSNKENNKGGSNDQSTDNSCPAYNRDDYSVWIDADGDCQDTRAEVLISKSTASVTYTTGAACVVATGQWYDPYTDTTFTSASQVDIDHVVPLEEAHASGAYAWSNTQKSEFANDLADTDQLLPVSSSVNSSKGARDPAEWLPPNSSYHVTYASIWAAIKIRWDLSSDSAELAALKSLLGSTAELPAEAAETNCTGAPGTGDSGGGSDTSCCKICKTGKACGDSCISKSDTCHQPPGCACDG